MKSQIRFSVRWPASVLVVGLVVQGLFCGGRRVGRYGTGQAAAPCVAMSSDGATTFSSLQDAVDAAASGGRVKVHGTCGDLQTRANTNQTAYVDQPLTIRGGYDGLVWTLSDPVANPTTLDAQGLVRAVVISCTVVATLENLTVAGGQIQGLDLCPDECGRGIEADPLARPRIEPSSGCLRREPAGGKPGVS